MIHRERAMPTSIATMRAGTRRRSRAAEAASAAAHASEGLQMDARWRSRDGKPRRGTLHVARAGVVGREGSIRVPDSRISRHHARIWHDGERWLVEDLGSSNGTWVEGRRIGGPTPLAEGMVMRIGRVPLRIVAAGAPCVAPGRSDAVAAADASGETAGDWGGVRPLAPLPIAEPPAPADAPAIAAEAATISPVAPEVVAACAAAVVAGGAAGGEARADERRDGVLGESSVPRDEAPRGSAALAPPAGQLGGSAKAHAAADDENPHDHLPEAYEPWAEEAPAEDAAAAGVPASDARPPESDGADEEDAFFQEEARNDLVASHLRLIFPPLSPRAAPVAASALPMLTGVAGAVAVGGLAAAVLSAL